MWIYLSVTAELLWNSFVILYLWTNETSLFTRQNALVWSHFKCKSTFGGYLYSGLSWGSNMLAKSGPRYGPWWMKGKGTKTCFVQGRIKVVLWDCRRLKQKLYQIMVHIMSSFTVVAKSHILYFISKTYSLGFTTVFWLLIYCHKHANIYCKNLY